MEPASRWLKGRIGFFEEDFTRHVFPCDIIGNSQRLRGQKLGWSMDGKQSG
jgi:hypothetical protein